METDEARLDWIVETTDEFIAHGNPAEVAFWLGYRHGIKHYLRGIANVVPSEEHQRFIEVVDQGHRDKFIDAYARGYLNGIDGKSPRELLDHGEPLPRRRHIEENLFTHFINPCQEES